MLWSFSEHFRLPLIPLLLLAGAAVAQVHLQPLGQQSALVWLAGLMLWLVFLDGGSSLGRNSIDDVRGTVAHLASVGPKLGWLLNSFLAQWIVGVEASYSFALGAVLMIGAPYALETLVLRLGGSDSCRRILLWETNLVGLFGAAWAALVATCLLAGEGHPGLGLTIKVTLWVALVGLALGALVMALMRLCARIPGQISQPIRLTLAFLCFALGHQVAGGAGVVAAACCGYWTARYPLSDSDAGLSDQLKVWGLSLLIMLQGALLSSTPGITDGWQRKLAYAFVLVLVARPLLVWVACRHARLSPRDRFTLSLVQPRGALTLATASVLLAGLGEDRVHLLSTVYYVVLVSNLVPVFLLPWAARLSSEKPESGQLPPSQTFLEKGLQVGDVECGVNGGGQIVDAAVPGNRAG